VDELLYHDLIHAGAQRFPDRFALTHGADRLTFAQLSARTTDLAGVLRDRGVRPGDRVGWWGATGADVAALCLACAQNGAIFCPVNPRFGPAEAEAVLRTAEAALVVTDGAHEGGVTLAELVAAPASGSTPDPVVDERSTHVMFFTSGTTGAPKGVEISHRADRLRAMSEAVPFSRGPSVVMFPLFHMAAWKHMQQAWVSGDEAVLVDGGDAPAIVAAIERHRAVRLYAIPAVWRRILDIDRYDLSSLRFADTGTSTTSPELLSALATAFPGAAISITYGSTEAGAVCRLGPDDVFSHPYSVGRLAPGYRARLDDGELCVRSPFLFTRYFRDEAATSRVLSEGWFRTGDVVELDHDGYLRIVGRRSDFIRTGGETVAPAEIDQILQTHPDLADAAVAGLTDDNWGEVIAAFVVPREGRSIELTDLRQHCAGRLASYKHPRLMFIVDELPRTGATRQIQRARLVDLVRAARPGPA
jgi:acyl-CoA synthetase (AMP-forming)/AMP-acid ligase II